MSIVATSLGSLNKPDEPYNDLPLLPPKRDLETKAVLKASLAAQVALADLRSAARMIPNDGILVRAITLQEARVSSEIEMVVTTNDELYRALSETEQAATPQTKEVLRYGEAVWLGYGHVMKHRGFDRNFLVRLAQTISGQPINVREGVGTRVGDVRSGKIVYTPPVGRVRIEGLLDNLVDYWSKVKDIDPLVRMCVGHYQFEAIHPFPDANGRVGRVANILLLIQEGLLEKPILYLSKAIIEDKGSYYRGLRRVTEEEAWEDWILYMLDCVEVTALETRRRIEAIQHEMNEVVAFAEANMRRGFSMKLMRLIFSQPYTRIPFLEREGIAKRQTASEYLQELERIGILRGVKRGREMYYLNERLLQILGA